MLVDKSDVGFSADDISKELRTNVTSAKLYLKDLSESGLLKNENNKYFYSPQTDDLNEKVIKTSSLYREMPVTIVTLIFERPQDMLKDLSNAFKLKKD